MIPISYSLEGEENADELRGVLEELPGPRRKAGSGKEVWETIALVGYITWH